MDSAALPQTYKAFAAKEDNLPPRIVKLPLPKPGEKQILVQMAFAPINPTDILCSQAFYRLSGQSPYLVGMEGSGTIVELGPGVDSSSYKVGEKVHVHAFGTHAQYALVDPSHVVPIKGDLSLEEAASHFVNPSAAAHFVALAQRGGHKAILSTAASSALGKMVIRAMKEIGVKTINTVRQDKYIEELKALGADYVLNTEAPDFEEKLKEIAEKDGVTLAFDAVNGDFTDKLVRLLPANSTVHVYGLFGGTKYSIFENKEFEDGKKVNGLMSGTYVHEFVERGELDKFYESVHSRLKTTYKTDIQKIYPLDEILEGIEYSEKNAAKGKVLIKMN